VLPGTLTVSHFSFMKLPCRCRSAAVKSATSYHLTNMHSLVRALEPLPVKARRTLPNQQSMSSSVSSHLRIKQAPTYRAQELRQHHGATRLHLCCNLLLDWADCSCTCQISICSISNRCYFNTSNTGELVHTLSMPDDRIMLLDQALARLSPRVMLPEPT
jgi:hypothetical protein